MTKTAKTSILDRLLKSAGNHKHTEASDSFTDKAVAKAAALIQETNELPKTLYFSQIYGNGIYQLTNEYINNPFQPSQSFQHPKSENNHLYAATVNNILTGEEYYLRLFHLPDGYTLENYKFRFMHQPEIEGIIWPSDLIMIPPFDNEKELVKLGHNYSAEEDLAGHYSCNMAYLFRKYDYPFTFRSLRDLYEIHKPDLSLLESEAYNWQKEEFQQALYNLVSKIDELNQSGFAYCDISLDQIWVGPNKEILLDYSELNFRLHDLYQYKYQCNKYQDKKETGLSDSRYKKHLQTAVNGQFPLETAESKFVKNDQLVMDFEYQNFALASLLFFILFNRYPFDGSQLFGMLEDEAYSYYSKFREYHENPVFIFDRTDESNHLENMADQIWIEKSWNEAPERLKELFCLTFEKKKGSQKRYWMESDDSPNQIKPASPANTSSSGDDSIYDSVNDSVNESDINAIESACGYLIPTPKDWLNCMKSLGWRIPSLS